MGLLNHSGLRRNIHRDLEFELLDKHGFPVKHRGAYVCTDGGYRKLAIFVTPEILTYERRAVVFSEWVESTRKDVECTNGIVKGRFRYFMYGVRHHSQQLIEGAFVTRVTRFLSNSNMLRKPGGQSFVV